MKKTLFLLCLLCLQIISYGQPELNDLEAAFRKRSNSALKEYLNKWQINSTPLTDLESLSPFQKDVYLIFQDFYDPFNLKRIGTGEYGENLYSNIDYVIIQNEISIKIFKTDSLNFRVFENTDALIQNIDSILNFRPLVTLKKPSLFLYPSYKTSINQFLRNQYYPLGTRGIMNPAYAKGSSKKRQEFLNREIKIIHGHWGGYWHIETHPYVFVINFNRDSTIARVDYKLVYQGGSAFYEKKNNIWTLKKAGLTWIE